MPPAILAAKVVAEEMHKGKLASDMTGIIIHQAEQVGQELIGKTLQDQPAALALHLTVIHVATTRTPQVGREAKETTGEIFKGKQPGDMTVTTIPPAEQAVQAPTGKTHEAQLAALALRLTGHHVATTRISPGVEEEGMDQDNDSS